MRAFRHRLGKAINAVLARAGYRVVGLGKLERLVRVEEVYSALVDLFSSVGQLPADERDEGFEFVRFCIDRHRESRAQLFQDLFALFVLKGKRNGFFVEFGAADGLSLSNTFHLEQEYAWKGIVAEPARSWHKALRANRNCVVDQSCIWSVSGERLSFNEAPDAVLSTVDARSGDDSHGDARQGGRRYMVDTLSLNDLLEKHEAPREIDYLSVDTEGTELDILGNFDFDRYQIRVITVEHNHTTQREQLHSLLSAKGFQRKFQALSRFDDWYVRK